MLVETNTLPHIGNCSSDDPKRMWTLLCIATGNCGWLCCSVGTTAFSPSVANVTLPLRRCKMTASCRDIVRINCCLHLGYLELWFHDCSSDGHSFRWSQYHVLTIRSSQQERTTRAASKRLTHHMLHSRLYWQIVAHLWPLYPWSTMIFPWSEV